jgi:hypothetical protein
VQQGERPYLLDCAEKVAARRFDAGLRAILAWRVFGYPRFCGCRDLVIERYNHAYPRKVDQAGLFPDKRAFLTRHGTELIKSGT